MQGSEIESVHFLQKMVFMVSLPNKMSVVLLQFLTCDKTPNFSVDCKEVVEKSLHFFSEEKEVAVQFWTFSQNW